MGVPIFQKPERRNPFKEATDTALKGVNQIVEQDVMDKLLANIDRGSDPLQAILASRLSPERKSEVAKIFQEREKTQGAFNLQRQKQQQEQEAKIATAEEIERLSGGKIQKEDVVNLPQAAQNSIVTNLTKKPEKETPQEKGFSKIVEKVYDKAGDLNQRIADSNRALELAKSGRVGVDFDTGGGVTDIARQGARLLGIDVALTADEAQLQNLILRRADELKKKFGSRITNFDFEQWLKGQPALNKLRNANIAVAYMQQAESRREELELQVMNEILSDPTIPTEDQLSAFLERQREIIQLVDQELTDNIKSINPESATAFGENPEQARLDDIRNQSANVSAILEDTKTEQGKKRLRAQIRSERRRREKNG